MAKPLLSKEELRAQLEAALANYHGPVTHCPAGAGRSLSLSPRNWTSTMTMRRLTHSL